ncbi:hypothetical protein J6590_097661 [Homalodisca vitripennis]|nr:hypothetical protein J6590_097661 [Homalodisca vitripennis]
MAQRVAAAHFNISIPTIKRKLKGRSLNTGGERKEETWPVPAHSCVLVCCRAVISGASPHSQPCELFILAMELFVFSNVAFLQSVTHLRRAHYFSLSVLHHVEREVIRRVIEICDKEASDKVLTVPLAKATERAANYCKVLKQSIKRIRKEAKSTPAEKLMSPGKNRQRLIVNVIKDFYTVKKVVPTCKKLLLVLREIIHFVWSEWALRRELKNMGFRWKKCGSKRKLLIERSDIVNWRFEYLRNIKECRYNKKKIFYLDETWIDFNLTFQRCWQSLEVDGVLPDMNAANRVRKKVKGAKSPLQEKPSSKKRHKKQKQNQSFDDSTSEGDTACSLQDSDGNSDLVFSESEISDDLYMQTAELGQGPSTPLSPDLIPLNLDTLED